MEPDFRATQEAFARYVRDPEANPPPPGSRPERMAWYARLFFNNIDGTLETAFAGLRRTVPGDQWRDLGQRFFREHSLTSPLMRDVPAAFIDFLHQDAAAGEQLADWQRELATYELLRFEQLTAEDPTLPADLDPRADLLAGRPLVSPLARQLTATYPVDEIARTLETEPEHRPAPPEPTCRHLLVHRDTQGVPVTHRLSPASAGLIEAMLAHPESSGESILANLADAFGMPTEELTAFAAPQLEQWREEGILLGARPVEGPQAP